jgi:hypothetical protein
MAMTKKEALAVVFSCAVEYKNNLVDRSLLFVCTNKNKQVYCLEVTFDASNFLHMTGFKTTTSGIQAQHFFDLCIDQRLSEEDFEFSEDGTTPLKMKVLPGLVKKNLSANMIGDFNMSQPKLYTEKLTGGVKACIGFVRNKGDGRYVPNTVLEGDIRKRVKQTDRIILTYRKQRGEQQYSELVYSAKKVEWSKIKLPDNYKDLPLPQLPAIQEKEENEISIIIAKGTEIHNAIITYRDLEWNNEQIMEKLKQRFGLSKDEAIEAIQKIK